MTRRPPSFRLFPYTTLFRSHQLGELSRDREAEAAAARDGAVEAVDRKSTRLNSSHVSISYAVFCLKKKNSVVLDLIGVRFLSIFVLMTCCIPDMQTSSVRPR